MDRRQFLKAGLLTAGSFAFGGSFWRHALAAPAQPGAGPYGPLSTAPDANGLLLPEGFSSRILASGLQPVGSTGYVWHIFPDGGATYPTGDGGWIYVSNSEVPPGFVGNPQFPLPTGTVVSGGVGALRFDSAGEVVAAYRILDQTRQNCAGGPTPWGTWLSCEEYDFSDTPANEAGMVWECDPTQPGQGVAHPAMGRFSHEAVAVDPVQQRLYLTEDQPDGRFYRFTPENYPDLSAGLLEAASEGPDGAVTWVEVPDPLASEGTPTREQLADTTTGYPGGEGIWYDGQARAVYFTSKGDEHVRAYYLDDQRIEVVYDADAIGPDAPLRGVDNITVSSHGDLYVCEDGDNLEICIISTEREVAPVMRITNHQSGSLQEGGSEIAGAAFDPSGTRLYFSSQRGGAAGGPGFGVTYEVTGPFRVAAAQAEEPVTTTTAAAAGPATEGRGELPPTGDGGALLALGGVGLLGAAAAHWARRALDDEA